MPIVKTLGDRVEKYRAKTDPGRVGGRYEAARELARVRYIDGIAVTRDAVERARKILESLGVPAGMHGIYFAFVQKAASMSLSHSGESLVKIVQGLKALYVAKGADPAILDRLASVIV